MTIMKLRLGVRGMMWLTLVIMMWGIISCRTQEEKRLEEVLSLPLANKEELQKVLDHYKDDSEVSGRLLSNQEYAFSCRIRGKCFEALLPIF